MWKLRLRERLMIENLLKAIEIVTGRQGVRVRTRYSDNKVLRNARVLLYLIFL